MSLDLYIYDNMLKILRKRRESTQEMICFGVVPDYTTYKELRAVVAELAALEQDLKLLLDKIKEPDE
tara:strand:+ start:2468 stop:2668 length:201 start_codon:yes stop_codon:yes gene_type:complete